MRHDGDIRELLACLPWRGPVMPLLADAPEDMQPEVRALPRVRVFDLDSEDDRLAYERVLGRIDRGLAESRASELVHTPDGRFRALLVWAELYMCSPSYRDSEGAPVLRCHTGSDPVVAEGGVVDDRSEDERLHACMAEWAEQSDARARKAGESRKAAETAEQGTASVLVYAEDDGEVKQPQQQQTEDDSDVQA